MSGVRRALILACGFLAVGLQVPAQAQQPAQRFASAFVPPGHWALAAVRRLGALGLASPGFDPAMRSLTRREVGRILAHAATRAVETAPRLAGLTDGYHARFEEEFPEAAAALEQTIGDGGVAMGGRFELGYEHSGGRVLSGTGIDPETDAWVGARPLDDLDSGLAAGAWSGILFPAVAANISSSLRDGGARLDEGYVTAAWGNAGFWAGRRIMGFGPGVGGGVVLDGDLALDGGGLFLLDAVTLPTFLRYLGPVRFETFLSRGEQNGRFEHPWIWGARGSFAPAERLRIGISRAVMFGGEGNTTPTLRHLANVLVGKHSGKEGEFDNQVVSVDVRWRPPLGSLPAAIYLEWGFDDSAGAWRDVPAIVVGTELAALPGLPQVAVGFEHASFAESCCGNTMWYRNWSFTGGWADDGHPLGHPLGGHGTESLIYARTDLLEARLRVSGRLFVRDRGAENLFAPDREGASKGGALALELRAFDQFEAAIEGAVEDGSADWRSSRVLTALRLLF